MPHGHHSAQLFRSQELTFNSLSSDLNRVSKMRSGTVNYFISPRNLRFKVATRGAWAIPHYFERLEDDNTWWGTGMW